MDLRDEFEVPATAVVLAEGAFGKNAGKTANGTVMHSEIFETTAVIDSTEAGATTREVLGKSNAPAVPVVASLEDALEVDPDPDVLIVGVAPPGGSLPPEWEDTIRSAMDNGCDIVSGLHVFLSDRPQWTEYAKNCGVKIIDVRKPPSFENLRVADGRVDDVDAEVVLTMGTDCAVGKRTTTFELYHAAKARGIDAGWVATGQTGIMVGAHEGVVVDRVPADFTAGVVEDMVSSVGTDHDVVFVEGQASLAHRAYSGVTLSILHGSWPDGVVIVHEPNRSDRTLFAEFEVAGVETERAGIELLSNATVSAVSTWGDPQDEREKYDIPVANVYEEGGSDELLDAVLDVL